MRQLGLPGRKKVWKRGIGRDRRNLRCFWMIARSREKRLNARDVTDMTQLLEAVDQGDPKAADELLPLVYDDLRRLAARKMASEPSDHTLQATALVHESYLRLIGQGRVEWKNRRHFYAAAAEAMRRLLIERARRKRRVKHGGEFQRAEYDETQITCGLAEDDIQALSEALERLDRRDPRAAQVVKLRFFCGLRKEEIAESIHVSPRTVDAIWAFARAWLYQEVRLG